MTNDLPSVISIMSHKDRSSLYCDQRMIIDFESSSDIACDAPVDHRSPCTHHPLEASWWWKDKCKFCASENDKSYPSGPSEDISGALGDCDNVFGGLPDVSADGVSRFRLPSNVQTTPKNIKSVRTFSNASRRHQTRFPRMGSDSNPFSFTGKTLIIRREGLKAIGRNFEGSKTTNSSGYPWKC